MFPLNMVRAHESILVEKYMLRQNRQNRIEHKLTQRPPLRPSCRAEASQRRVRSVRKRRPAHRSLGEVSRHREKIICAFSSVRRSPQTVFKETTSRFRFFKIFVPFFGAREIHHQTMLHNSLNNNDMRKNATTMPLPQLSDTPALMGGQLPVASPFQTPRTIIEII